ncbi:RNA polymerase sigma factor [Parapedobacter koreensis]|uniref:RNA polymerase sigma-70 factor, ECF subfamily n=1 Tax=Parapedobacter koreensis TaxID=332977 RepID=A0A1H7UIL8_9SPHI|nr:sigma-70 family RNA polymerase sigma factor [Parapedobacter koreensis]SEL96659.1 RNA polymerase sigma-70 factor, ECF subfamily [Parapedobacter koreensis]
MQARVSNVPELFKKVAGGDDAAFKQVYEYFFPKIHAFALRVLHDHEHAQEVAQEVMLAIWQMGNRLADIRNPDAFLKTLSKRRTIDAWRRLQMERTAEQLMQANWKESDEETEERILLNETRQIIEEAILLLPPQQRTVYQLCHQQGMKYEEAARQLDIAPGTVQVHMKLALKFLRSYLQQRIDVAVLLFVFNLSL